MNKLNFNLKKETEEGRSYFNTSLFSIRVKMYLKKLNEANNELFELRKKVGE